MHRQMSAFEVNAISTRSNYTWQQTHHVNQQYLQCAMNWNCGICKDDDIHDASVSSIFFLSISKEINKSIQELM